MTDQNNHFEEHIRACICVFVSLLILTGVTVTASYLNFPSSATIAIALTIAAVKATLVLGYFMHLVSEKKLIYFTLALTALFFCGLIFLPVLGKLDPIRMLITREY